MHEVTTVNLFNSLHNIFIYSMKFKYIILQMQANDTIAPLTTTTLEYW